MQVKEHNHDPWLLTVVYGSPTHDLRKRLCKDLRKSNMNVSGPWLVAGDFNAVTTASEVSDSMNFSQRRCADFTNWIFEQGLIDIGFEGPMLTWKCGTQQSTFKGARLDRALGDIDWRMRYPNAVVKHLPMIHSDHAPLMISAEDNTVNRKRH